MAEPGSASLLVASNRGPLSFSETDDGTLEASRGGGGLVSGLSSLGSEGVVWVCAALSDGDRIAARRAPNGRLDHDGHDTDGAAVRMLDIDAATFQRAYNAVANSTLWFVHHLLYAVPTSPNFDAGFRREWASYEAYNRAFAEALAAEAAEGAKVLVQDYHLTLTPRLLRDLRPDLRIAHFSHTPWAPVDYYRLLPPDVARETLLGMLGADHAGFHSQRWARSFADCCAHVLGAETDGSSVTYEGRTTHLGVHPLGVDADALRERAHQHDVDSRLAALRRKLGDRKAIVRVDRTELSKNISRGLLAYSELLRRYPEWRGKVTHLASAYPSRHDLPEYREYTATVQRMATEIEDEFGTEDWRPIVLDVTDDYARSLALYRAGDVLLVNPVRDGMNLVAKEVPILSEDGCVVVLSTEAGAADEFSEDALMVNPFDISGTADALHAALSMSDDERRQRTKRLAAVATAMPPSTWLARQVDAI
ncbi:MAG TPA: trehalose-6-phosphate synthase [Actinomycetes bacterium]|nr:trehalose-6-phosphate synthase [Actinomycetes bacterium]